MIYKKQRMRPKKEEIKNKAAEHIEKRNEINSKLRKIEQQMD